MLDEISFDLGKDGCHMLSGLGSRSIANMVMQKGRATLQQFKNF